jgi:hypothetical protein
MKTDFKGTIDQTNQLTTATFPSDDFKVKCPTGLGKFMTPNEALAELSATSQIFSRKAIHLIPSAANFCSCPPRSWTINLNSTMKTPTSTIQ